MKKMMFVAVVLAASVASAGKAGAQANTVQALLDQASIVVTNRGMTRDSSNHGGEVVGALAEDGRAQFQIRVRAGTQYSIVGVCDYACAVLDLAVKFGSTLVFNDTIGDTPVIHFTAPDSALYMVTVNMARCAADPCAFAFRIFTK